MHPDTYKRPLLWVLIFLLAALCFFYKPTPGKQDVFHAVSKDEVTLTGRVESFAVAKKDSENVVVQVLTLNGAPASGRVYARFANGAPQWKDTVSFTGKLQVPFGAELPGQFNWKRYLAQQQIFTEIKSDEFTRVQRAGFFWRTVRALRRSILRTFKGSFSPDLAGIAGGILLGERGEISPQLYTQFQDSGAIHLLVASGGNVGFVTLLTLLLGAWVGLRRRPLLLLTLVTAGFYTLVAGADAPLVRAYLMAVGACVGYFLGRNSGVFQGLLLSCLVIIGFHPAAVFETGFQMSFLATLAIIICLTSYQPPAKWPRAVRFFAQIFLATLASQLVLLPIFTNVFYKVSVAGLLSNMLLVPLASGLMAVSFLYYLFSVLHIGIIFYYPCLWGLETFKFLVEFFGTLRFSSLPVTAWNGGSIVAYYSLLFLFFHLPRRDFARNLALPCIVLAVVAWSAGYFCARTPRVYLIGQWNERAVLVRTEKREMVVFSSGLAPEKITQAVHALGIEKPAAVFSLVPGKEEPVPGVHEAFSDMWPGEEIAVGTMRVRAAWEMHQAKDGRVWTNTGYTGRTKDGISYCLQAEQKTLCIGAQARFVQLPDEQFVNGLPNEVVSARW